MLLAPHLVLIASAVGVPHRVAVIGGGIAGLRCAQRLSQSDDCVVTLIEAAPQLGGRVQSDITEDGFTLDRGFQVFLDAYPESRACLDYTQLDLRKFTAGATIVQRRADNGTQRAWMTVADPLREPKFLLPTLAFPLGSLADKVRLVLAVVALKLCSLDSIFAQDDVPLSVHLRERLRLSEEITGAFFTPFLRGIFLAPLQEQSTILFQFVLKMFLEGSACLPGAPGGIGAVPAMLARSITEQTDIDGSSSSTIRLSARVETLHLQRPRHAIAFSGGSAAPLYCDSVVVATPRREAKRLLGDALFDASQSAGSSGDAGDASDERAPLGSACLYYALSHPPPVQDPILVLNGDLARNGNGNGDGGIINTLCFPSVVSPSYAPAGMHLASVSVVGEAVARGMGGLPGDEGKAALERAVRTELMAWFGAEEIDQGRGGVGWRHLRTYVIDCAQEARPPLGRVGRRASSGGDGFNRPPRVQGVSGVYVCGDHAATPSLNGALRSGRLAAEAVLADLEAT